MVWRLKERSFLINLYKIDVRITMAARIERLFTAINVNASLSLKLNFTTLILNNIIYYLICIVSKHISSRYLLALQM